MQENNLKEKTIKRPWQVLSLIMKNFFKKYKFFFIIPFFILVFIVLIMIFVVNELDKNRWLIINDKAYCWIGFPYDFSTELKDVDIETFKNLGDGYAKDKSKIYFCEPKICESAKIESDFENLIFLEKKALKRVEKKNCLRLGKIINCSF